LIIHEPITDLALGTDVCIIGGGPAAIVIALELLQTKRDVIMLTGGGERRESAADQDLNRGIVRPEGSHEDLEENRRRVFGGATSAWGGRCIPFDAIDFEVRPWIPHSGWPINYQTLEGYYREAMRLCQAGEFEFDSRKVFTGKPKEISYGLDSPEIESWHMERWSPPVNFASQYREVLEKADNVKVLLNTHLIELRAERSKESISAARVVSTGNSFEIRAKCYILATGGIENARILLSSRGPFYRNGIGNDNDLVGRFYMCHPHGAFAALALKKPRQAILGYERDRDGVYCRRRWWIPEDKQRSRKIGNIVFYLDRPDTELGPQDAFLSWVFLARALMGIIKAPGATNKYERLKKDRKIRWHHLQAAIGGSFAVAPRLLQVGRARFFQQRRIPSALPAPNAAYWGLFFQAEQVPNPQSRITLSSDEKDAHGMPRAVASLAFTEIDRKTVIEAHRIFMERYKEAEAGTAIFSEDGLEQFLLGFSDRFNSGSHHMGTTRMAASPDCGVVDANCKVFGTENLYVAGSSVFPTGGHANPTLTIVALSVRLGKYLAGHQI
jgi:choline dehydrogenase-like flavoprotein